MEPDACEPEACEPASTTSVSNPVCSAVNLYRDAPLSDCSNSSTEPRSTTLVGMIGPVPSPPAGLAAKFQFK